MIWVWAGISWLCASFLVALILGELPPPKSDLERRMDYESYLRECNRKAHAKLDELDKLKAKISGSEA